MSKIDVEVNNLDNSNNDLKQVHNNFYSMTSYSIGRTLTNPKPTNSFKKSRGSTAVVAFDEIFDLTMTMLNEVERLLTNSIKYFESVGVNFSEMDEALSDMWRGDNAK